MVETISKTKHGEHSGTISRPVQQTMRHTAHGSAFGSSWGNPACLRPMSPVSDDSLRGRHAYNCFYFKFFNPCFAGRTLDSSLRKKKSSLNQQTVDEHHARERKSVAQKQFAYNKLKSDKQLNHQTSHTMAKTKPSRPPQPKISNTEKEGILIDLGEGSSFQNVPTSLARPQAIHMSSMISILDEPIDVPTEYSANSMESTKLEPPPYHSPPTYSNTYNIAHNSEQYSGNIFNTNTLDPFDTSYIGVQKQSPVINRYGANIDHSPPQQNGQRNTQSGAISKLTPMTNQLDAVVSNTMASMSPRNSTRNLSTSFNDLQNKNLTASMNNQAIYGNTNRQSVHASELDLSSLMLATPQPAEEDSLSDSMRVNLSTRTIDDSLSSMTPTSANNSAVSTPPKRLDKSFYADLEKNIYKNENTAASLLQNTSQTYANSNAHKANTVSTMPSEIYERRPMDDPMHLNKVQNTTARPSKFTNQSKSINQELAQRFGSYDSNVAVAHQINAAAKNYGQGPFQMQKQNNTEAAVGAVGYSSQPSLPDDATNQVINQIWFEQQAASLSTRPPASNSSQVEANSLPPSVGATSINWHMPTNSISNSHNFVAISNRPVSMMSELPRYDMYSSVAGDIYGSLAGDRYEPVAGSVYGTIPSNSAIYGNASTMPSMQPVLYDEVLFHIFSRLLNYSYCFDICF